MASAMRLHDDPWRRLPWLAPVSLVIALLSLMGFLRLLAQVPDRPRSPAPLDVGLVELPASEAAPPAITAAPPAAVAPPSPPDPEIVAPAPEEPLPEPMPELKVEAKPPPPRPQKRPPPPRSTERAIEPAPAAAPESRPTVPEAVAPSSPVGGSIGARAIFQPMPSIPESLRQRRLDAVAIVVFHVAADGSATVELREATEDPRLNQMLLEGFKRWRFFPALDHDRPIASTIELRVPIAVR
jgi:protein TonB